MHIKGRIFTMERCVKMIGMVCLLVPVSGQQTGGGVLSCPLRWVNNTAAKLTFFIDESKFPSRCNGTDRRPYFQRSTDGSSNNQINCTVSDITAAGACSGSFTPGSLGCGCTAKDGGYYVVEYNFIAHPDYNGWWSASITCLDSSSNQVLSFAKSDCDNKAVESGEQGGGVLICQHTWTINSTVKLTLAIDESKFPTHCTYTKNETLFQRRTNEHSDDLTTNCTVSDITAPGACSGSFTSGSLGCGCTAKDGNYYIVEYNFIAHPDYNGWWSTAVDCRDKHQSQLLSFTKSDCDNKEATAGNEEENPKQGACANGAGVGALVFVAFIVITCAT